MFLLYAYQIRQQNGKPNDMLQAGEEPLLLQ